MDAILFITQTLLSSIIVLVALDRFYFPKILKTITKGNDEIVKAVEDVLVETIQEPLPPLTDVEVVSFRPVSPNRHVVVFKKGDTQWKVSVATPDDLPTKELPEIIQYFLEKGEARYH